MFLGKIICFGIAWLVSFSFFFFFNVYSSIYCIFCLYYLFSWHFYSFIFIYLFLGHAMWHMGA